MIPYLKGSVVFAKNGDQFITLFDGEREVRISKAALKHIQLLGRTESQDSEAIQRRFDAKKASQEAGFGPTPKKAKEKIIP